MYIASSRMMKNCHLHLDLSGSFNNCEACGVLETMRISAAGYLSRWIHEDFARRYRLVYPEKKLWHEKQKFLQKNYAINILGTKVFFRVGHVALLEKILHEKLLYSRAFLVYRSMKYIQDKPL
ncbi:Unconventional myosin-Vb [Dirofilaria immitis]